MTELEQLEDDLETIQKAAKIAKALGYPDRTGNYDMVESELKGKIADLEAQEQEVDPWKKAKDALFQWEVLGIEPDKMRKHVIFLYVKNLQAKVDELDHKLRCEQVDGGKVRADRKAISAERNREKLAELTTIANAIPPACGLARELVDKRIESVKREMQG